MGIFQHISTQYKVSILQCWAIISTGRIGQINSFPRFSRSHTLSGYFGKHFLPRQKEWLSTKQNGRQAISAHKFLVGCFAVRASRAEPLFIGDQLFEALQLPLRNTMVLDAGGRRGSQGRHIRAGPRCASQAGLAEAQHQGTKQTEARYCSCWAPNPSGQDAQGRLLQQPPRHWSPSILPHHIYTAASSPRLSYCQSALK